MTGCTKDPAVQIDETDLPTDVGDMNLGCFSSTFIDSIVETMADDSVEISNIRSNFNSSVDNTMGTFSIDASSFDMKKGVVLSTGDISELFDGNSESGKTGKKKDTICTTDDEVQAFLNEHSDLFDNKKGYDITYVEFDFKVNADTIGIDYIFGSEEYPEFVDSDFSDGFAFLISGPGISGHANMAEINGEPITINTLNSTSNADYFVENYKKDSPLYDYIEFDGLTSKINAKIAIVPNEVYHIKIAICDVGDAILDSGVFIEAKSLRGY